MNKNIADWFNENSGRVRSLMHEIWSHPEAGLCEHHCCEAAADFLRTEGFEVSLHDAANFSLPDSAPNCVVASWGSGRPVIAFIGELDALPGLGQAVVPYQSPIPGCGHGCGHNLISGGAAGAGAALRYTMEKEHLAGTIRVIEAPAEELGCGKALLAEAGVFSGLDLALMWHPYHSDFQFDTYRPHVVYNADFCFSGRTSHASGAPWLGRSALDAVQLMDIGCEFMREHMLPTDRMHYTITDGGEAPNIVPDSAAVHYMFRALDDLDEARGLYERACRAAQGAAMMTDTQVTARLLSVLPKFYMNEPLHRRMFGAAQKVPPLTYSPEEYAFAREIYKNAMGSDAPEKDEELLGTHIAPYTGKSVDITMCTDAACMSYFCPTLHLIGGVRPIGTPSHHWMVTALAGMSIGESAGIYAYTILAQGAYEALTDPDFTAECRRYFDESGIPAYGSWLRPADGRD